MERKEININFEEIRKAMINNNEEYNFYNYTREIFEDLQEKANNQETTILEQLDNINNEGSYRYNIYRTLEKLSNIYESLGDFILTNKTETRQDLSYLFFENIEVLEIYLLYDIYYKYIIDYDNDNEDEKRKKNNKLLSLLFYFYN